MSEIKKHSKFAASSSERWINCPGSVALSEKAPPQISSVYADEGTKAHEYAEHWLHGRGKDRPSEEIHNAVKVYVEYVNGLHSETKGSLAIETKVSLEHINPDMFGTLDAAIVDYFNTLHIIDFKYGQGHAVEVIGNSQLAYYAVGMAHKFNWAFEKVVLHIVQPRAYHPEGPIRIVEMSINELRQWEEAFKLAVMRVEEKATEFHSGSWCRWCPALSICGEVKRLALEDAQEDFSNNLTFPNVKELTEEHIGYVLQKADLIETWIDSVRKHAFEIMNRGGSIAGFKLVPKRAIRKWVDEGQVHSALVQHQIDLYDFVERKIKSPAQIEKQDPEVYELLQEFVTQESSGLTIVPESDKRPAVACGPQVDFKDEPKQIAKPKGVKNGRSKK